MAIVLEPKYDQIKPFENGFARVELNKNWGIINAEGKEVVEPAYAEIGNYFKTQLGLERQNFWACKRW